VDLFTEPLHRSTEAYPDFTLRQVPTQRPFLTPPSDFRNGLDFGQYQDSSSPFQHIQPSHLQPLGTSSSPTAFPITSNFPTHAQLSVPNIPTQVAQPPLPPPVQNVLTANVPQMNSLNSPFYRQECERCKKWFTTHIRHRHVLEAQEQQLRLCNLCKRKVHECGSCDETFTLRKDLERHVFSVHSGDQKPFSCPHCPKAYNRKDHLRRHMRKCSQSVNGMQNSNTG